MSDWSRRKTHATLKTNMQRLRSTLKLDGLTTWAMTLSSTSPHHSRRCHFVQQRTLLFNLSLLGGNRPNQNPEDRFGYDVRNRIPDLLTGCRRHTGDPEHLDDVHEGIGQPRDDRQPASVSRKRCDRWRLLPTRLTQSDGQLRYNIDKRNHGKEPPEPPASGIRLDLPWVTKSHHDSRSDTQRPALAHRFRSWQSHNENQLDQQERDRQNPIDIPISIVERRTGEANHVLSLLRVELHIKSIVPGVENAEVVVCRDEGHQASDGERCAVLLVDVIDLEPEEYRRTSHPRDAERESVVHRAPASVVPSIDERRHVLRLRACETSLEP